MRRVVWAVSLVAVVVSQGTPAGANHLDCNRPWPGTLTEANQAWAACKERDAQEYRQMLQEQQRRQDAAREQWEQRQIEERRGRALEEAGRAQREQAEAAREAAQPQQTQTTCGWEYSFTQGRVWVCRRGPMPR